MGRSTDRSTLVGNKGVNALYFKDSLWVVGAAAGLNYGQSKAFFLWVWDGKKYVPGGEYKYPLGMRMA